jgi:hypothetical protein
VATYTSERVIFIVLISIHILSLVARHAELTEVKADTYTNTFTCRKLTYPTVFGI